MRKKFCTYLGMGFLLNCLALGAALGVERTLLKIDGEDPEQENVLEETTVTIIEDANGLLGGIRVRSEKGTVSESYTLAQLQRMNDAPIHFSGFRVLEINGRKLTRDGGELILTYFKNVLNPFSSSDEIVMDIVHEPGRWKPLINDSAGRREFTWLHLILHSVAGTPVGVEGYRAE